VLGGHSQLAPGQPDVFYNLDQVSIGDEIIITETGSVRRYSVTDVYRANQYDIAPLRPTSHEQLTLITCDSASYDANSGGYNNRVVVVALPTQ
jgi:LPXTG-site transpeptidase (sortase) family protein